MALVRSRPCCVDRWESVSLVMANLKCVPTMVCGLLAVCQLNMEKLSGVTTVVRGLVGVCQFSYMARLHCATTVVHWLVEICQLSLDMAHLRHDSSTGGSLSAWSWQGLVMSRQWSVGSWEFSHGKTCMRVTMQKWCVHVKITFRS